MNQITLDAALAEEMKRTAIEHADYATNPLWRDRALDAVLAVAKSHREFTTDLVWLELSKTDGMSTPEPRAMGPIMITAVKRGWCRPTDRFKPTDRPAAHRNPKRVYVSLLYG